MIELRWIRYEAKKTEPDRLQWREVEQNDQGEICIRNWSDVPVVVISEYPEVKDKSGLGALPCDPGPWSKDIFDGKI